MRRAPIEGVSYVTQMSGANFTSRGKKRKIEGEEQNVVCEIFALPTPSKKKKLKEKKKSSSPGWSRWCISRCIRSEKASPSSNLSTGDSRPMSQSLSPASLSPRPLSLRLNLSMSCNAYLSRGGGEITNIYASVSRRRRICKTRLTVDIFGNARRVLSVWQADRICPRRRLMMNKYVV